METEVEKAKRLGYHTGSLPQEIYSDLGSSLMSFASTLYHLRDDLAGKESGIAKFFDQKAGESGIRLGETNMSRGGTLEKAHWFTIHKIGVKASQRVSALSTDKEDKLWYQRILQTLFRYGVLRFNIAGIAPIGEFRLSQLLPPIQSVGQAIASAEDMEASGNTAPVFAASIFDLDKKQIVLSELASFNVDIQWDIPNRVWNAAKGAYDTLDASKPAEAELMKIPPKTLVEVQLIGVETRGV